MEGFHTYAALSEGEADAHRRTALRGLAMAEKHHADLWAGRIKELSGEEPQYTGKPDGQAGSLANRVGGADLALRRLEIDEGRDIAKYGQQLKALGDQPSIAILEEVIADEREHYLTLGNLIRSRGALPALPSEQAQAALDDLITSCRPTTNAQVSQGPMSIQNILLEIIGTLIVLFGLREVFRDIFHPTHSGTFSEFVA
jgi:vacuolar iron transporter family protein